MVGFSLQSLARTGGLHGEWLGEDWTMGFKGGGVGKDKLDQP
jgi:hypothetical protein